MAAGFVKEFAQHFYQPHHFEYRLILSPDLTGEAIAG
jgi:hypothetical protein